MNDNDTTAYQNLQATAKKSSQPKPLKELALAITKIDSFLFLIKFYSQLNKYICMKLRNFTYFTIEIQKHNDTSNTTLCPAPNPHPPLFLPYLFLVFFYFLQWHIFISIHNHRLNNTLPEDVTQYQVEITKQKNVQNPTIPQGYR